MNRRAFSCRKYGRERKWRGGHCVVEGQKSVRQAINRSVPSPSVIVILIRVRTTSRSSLTKKQNLKNDFAARAAMSNPKDPKPAADAGSCPVPHSARAAWLSGVKASSSSSSTSCDSSKIDQSLPTDHPPLPPPPPTSSNPPPRILGVHREISSIPRVNLDGSNSEHDPKTPPQKSTNWIYPSEEMFFNAMKRKDWNPNTEDMRTIVPIHNAVNERAWKEIREWEAGKGSEK